MNTYHVYYGSGQCEVLFGNCFVESFLEIYKPINLSSIFNVVKNELTTISGKPEHIGPFDLEKLHELILLKELLKEMASYFGALRLMTDMHYYPIMGGLTLKDFVTILDKQINEF